ncbi:MAG: hypothetical protein Q8M22_14940 [Actinomycetota bacterium]|nr:hypothetical protein [Actinomycetota bacterium]
MSRNPRVRVRRRGVSLLVLLAFAACGESARVTADTAGPSTTSAASETTTTVGTTTTTTLPVACSVDVTGAVSSPSDVEFWRQQVNYLDWIRFAASFEELHEMADVSVVARVVDAHPAEPVELGVDGMFLANVLLDLEVIVDVKGGDLEQVALMVEAPSSFDPSGPLTYDQWFDAFVQHLPSGAAYLALVRRPDIAVPVYQPISGLSIWVQTPDGLEPGYTQYQSEMDRTPAFWASTTDTATLSQLACMLAMG